MIKNSVSLKFLVVFFLLTFAWFVFINCMGFFYFLDGDTWLFSDKFSGFAFIYHLFGGFIINYFFENQKELIFSFITIFYGVFVCFIIIKILQELTSYFISKSLRCNEKLYLFLLFLLVSFAFFVFDMIIHIFLFYFFQEENYSTYWYKLYPLKAILSYIFSFIIVFLKFKFYKKKLPPLKACERVSP